MNCDKLCSPLTFTIQLDIVQKVLEISNGYIILVLQDKSSALQRYSYYSLAMLYIINEQIFKFFMMCISQNIRINVTQGRRTSDHEEQRRGPIEREMLWSWIKRNQEWTSTEVFILFKNKMNNVFNFLKSKCTLKQIHFSWNLDNPQEVQM